MSIVFQDGLSGILVFFTSEIKLFTEFELLTPYPEIIKGFLDLLIS